MKAATGPEARSFIALACDSARGTCLLFGGQDSAGGYLGETWEWSGTAWAERLGPGPPARAFHAMAYDSLLMPLRVRSF